jgi:multimeric flavodoxin WrbA
MRGSVIIIQGSPRRGGNTERAARRIAERTAGRLDLRVVNLCDIRIRRCEGCRRCMTHGVCVIDDDDFPALWRDLRSARVIVQACPVYWHSPPGIMKDFIDRTHSTYLDRRSLDGAQAYLVTVAADSGFETCETVMASWVTAYGGRIASAVRLFARDLGELEQRPENTRRLDELAEEIARAGLQGGRSSP